MKLADLRRLHEAATEIEPGYFVTRDGRVFSTKGWRGEGVRLLAQHPNADGYLQVHLAIDGKRVRRAVHQLVAWAYVGSRPSPSHEVRHLDGNRRNNCADNLAWGTRKENAADRDRHGTTARGDRNGARSSVGREHIGDASRRWHAANPGVVAGERHGEAKLTEADVRTIRERREAGAKLSELAKVYGVNETLISRVARRKAWTHVA